jgi:two-component system, LytTR family, sensor kinase
MKRNPNRRASLVSPQMALLTIVGFWIFHALIVSLRAAVLDFPQQDELSSRRLVVAVIGIMLTWGLYIFLRVFDRKPLPQRVGVAFLAAIPCAFGVAWVNYYVFNIYDPISLFEDQVLSQKVQDLQNQMGITPLQQVVELAITRYFFIIAWATMYLALSVAGEVRLAERRAARFAQAAQDAELRSLRYQVNPHFLFNTLNSLSSLVMTGRQVQAEAMIQNLSTFYRNSLSSDPLEDVTLAEEVELQKLYLDIEYVRFPKRLKVQINIDPALSQTSVPALILQPLVENAIKYGVARSSRPVTITISAARTDDGISIIVEDDGEPQNDIPHAESSGIGLPNVRDRLEARFGKNAKLETLVKPPGGFIACITLFHNDAATGVTALPDYYATDSDQKDDHL